MNNNKSAPCTNEVDVLLDQLLPHPEDVPLFEPERSDTIAYKDIRRVRLNNGILAVRLPDGTTIARSLDRKAGKAFWVRVRA